VTLSYNSKYVVSDMSISHWLVAIELVRNHTSTLLGHADMTLAMTFLVVFWILCSIVTVYVYVYCVIRLQKAI